MHSIIPPTLSSTFVTLLVTIGPVETAAVFAGVTGELTWPARTSLARRSVVIAGLVLLLFAVGGGPVLSLLHVTLPAFRVAGGALLFLQAVTMVFSGPGMSSISEGERAEAKGGGDIAVFPLAFPIVAGPGALAAVVLLMGRAQGVSGAGAVIVTLIVCLGLTYFAILCSERLIMVLGQTGCDVVGRISGVLLVALAVQFVFDGMREAGPFVTP